MAPSTGIPKVTPLPYRFSRIAQHSTIQAAGNCVMSLFREWIMVADHIGAFTRGRTTGWLKGSLRLLQSFTFRATRASMPDRPEKLGMLISAVGEALDGRSTPAYSMLDRRPVKISI